MQHAAPRSHVERLVAERHERAVAVLHVYVGDDVLQDAALLGLEGVCVCVLLFGGGPGGSSYGPPRMEGGRFARGTLLCVDAAARVLQRRPTAAAPPRVRMCFVRRPERDRLLSMNEAKRLPEIICGIFIPSSMRWITQPPSTGPGGRCLGVSRAFVF